MPDTATDTSSPAGADIGSLITPDSQKGRELAEGMSSITRREIESKDRIRSNTEHDINYDQGQVHRAFEATGVGPDQLQPWDDEQQRRKFTHEPLEAFSSLGSVFGLLAAAFTGAPMESGLNASAAAIQALKQGDDQAYDRAHTAWKENMDLAVKRHNMMRESYSDAITLMNSDMSAGTAKLQIEAARFGDKRVQFLLENGMNEELFKLMDGRNKAITGAMEANEKLDQHSIQSSLYNSMSKSIDDAAEQTKKQGGEVNSTEIAARKMQAFNRIYKAKTDTPSQEILGTYLAQHPNATAEELAKFATDNNLLPYRARGADAQIIEALKQEREDAGQPPPTANEIAEAISKSKGRGASGATTLTVDRQNAAAADKHAQKYREDNPNATDEDVQTERAKYYAQLKTQSAGLTGTRKDQLESRKTQIKYSVGAIDKAESLLKKHNALTGLGGKISRPGESIASVFGSNETDRHEFESLISEIKEWAPRILTDSQGRPLSSEAGNLDKIVRGLNLGDTTKITADRLLNLRKQYQEMSTDTDTRIHGGSGQPPAAAPAAGGAKKPWESAPIVKPVSALETDDQAA